MADDQGWAKDDAVTDAAHHQAIGDTGVADDGARGSFSSTKALVGALLGDDLYRTDET